MIIKKLRKQKGWSQEHLAALCGLNVRTIQRVENGNKASLETLQSLASVFEVNVSVLTEEVTVIDKQSELWKSPTLAVAAAVFWRTIEKNSNLAGMFFAVVGSDHVVRHGS